MRTQSGLRSTTDMPPEEWPCHPGTGPRLDSLPSWGCQNHGLGVILKGSLDKLARFGEYVG